MEPIFEVYSKKQKKKSMIKSLRKSNLTGYMETIFTVESGWALEQETREGMDSP